MWLFMYACYGLTAVSVLLLGTAGLQGYTGFALFGVSHPRLAILATIVYLFTQTLIMFFFVGTGATVREFVKENIAFSECHARSRALKSKVFPPIMLNMLLVMTVFIAGAALDTGHIPRWAHGLPFLAALIHFAWTIRVEHRAFRETTAIILEMHGLELKVSPGMKSPS